MKKLKTTVHWIMLTVHFALVAAMAYIAFPTLIDWWGVIWITVLGVTLGVLFVLVPIWYRLTRGKWPAFYVFLLGCFTGCLGLIVSGLIMLSFPVAYRIVEGSWPISFLVVQGSAIVVGVLEELYEKYVLKKEDSGEAP